MNNITKGPWDWDTPTPREQVHEAHLADALDFVIAKIEADPNDIRALNRHSPDDIQLRGNYTTVPPPRELYPLAAVR